MRSWFEKFEVGDETFERDRLGFIVFGSDGDEKDVRDDRIRGVYAVDMSGCEVGEGWAGGKFKFGENEACIGYIKGKRETGKEETRKERQKEEKEKKEQW